MTELIYRPIKHRHAAYLKKAGKRPGFKAAYDAVAIEYALANEMLTRARSRLAQEAVASLMSTSKSTVSRLESAGKHSPSISSLQKYAQVVGCTVEVRLVPQR